MEESGTFKSHFTLAPLRGIWTDTGAQRAVALMLIIAVTLLVLWPTTATLLTRWSDTVTRAYTHGALVPLMCAFIAWHRRAQFAAVSVAPSLLAFGVTLALGVAWLVAYRAGITIGHQALLPLICIALAWTIFGWPLVRRALFPLGFLFFTIPLWDALVPGLQWASTLAVRGMLSVIGIPVYFDGLEFQIPAGRFEIAGGCSGLHFFIVALAIAAFYGELHRDTRRTRIKLLVLAALAALLTNWVRIAIIIVAGHETDMRHYLVSGEHYSFGWGMFAVAMAIYFFIVRRWPVSAAPGLVEEPARGIAVPARGVALAAAGLLLPALPVWLDANIATAEAVSRHVLPEQVAGWQGRGAVFAAPPRFDNADVTQSLEFESRGETVQAFSAAYRQQMQGKELGQFSNAPLGERVAPVSRPRVSADGAWLEIEGRDRTGGRWLVFLQYRVGERAFLDTHRAQIFYGATSLWSDPVSSALVLRAPCGASCDAARVSLERFAGRLARP